MNPEISFEPELAVLAKQVDQWQKKKKPGERMSKELWSRIIALCDHLSQKEVAEAVGVKLTYLHERIRRRNQDKKSAVKKRENSHFVPVGIFSGSEKVIVRLESPYQKAAVLKMGFTEFGNSLSEILDWMSKKS